MKPIILPKTGFQKFRNSAFFFLTSFWKLLYFQDRDLDLIEGYTDMIYTSIPEGMYRRGLALFLLKKLKFRTQITRTRTR